MRDFFSRLAEVFQGKPRKGASPPSRTSTEYGFLVFQHTGEVIRAERILREAGFAVEVKGPPPELRTGCDMIIVFDLMQEPLIRNALGAARLEPMMEEDQRLGDNEASLENVTRAAEKKGWNVTPKDQGGGVFRLELRK